MAKRKGKIIPRVFPYEFIFRNVTPEYFKILDLAKVDTFGWMQRDPDESQVVIFTSEQAEIILDYYLNKVEKIKGDQPDGKSGYYLNFKQGEEPNEI